MSKARQLADLGGDTANLEDISSVLSSGQLGNRNLIINGAMQVAQRGTSDTSFTLGYALDRMYLDQFSATGGTHTYQQLSSDPPVGFRNYLRWQRNSGETATGLMRIYYTGETGASGSIAGNKLTLSFYARAGADYSGGNLESRIVTGEGTDQSRNGWANGLWTNQVNDIQDNTLTTSWQRFTHTSTSACGNDVSQHALRFVWTPTGTASTNDYIEITGVQLEVGDTATPFEHRSYGQELALCQRYYLTFGGTAYQGYSLGECNSVNVAVMVKNFPNDMRVTPTFTYSGNFRVREAGSAHDVDNGLTLSVSSPQSCVFIAEFTTSVLAVGNACRFYNNNDANARLNFDAEL